MEHDAGHRGSRSMTAPIGLQKGQVALFGYGSLLSRRSLERTLGRPYDGPLISCSLPGWRRTWDAAMANENFFFAEVDGEKLYPGRILYLNVAPDPNAILNGILFVIEEADLARFDKREWIYDRVEISAQLQASLQTGQAFLYVCKPEHCAGAVTSSKEAAIRATYLQTVEDGISERDASFRAGYDLSTDIPPPQLVIQDQTE